MIVKRSTNKQSKHIYIDMNDSDKDYHTFKIVKILPNGDEIVIEGFISDINNSIRIHKSKNVKIGLSIHDYNKTEDKQDNTTRLNSEF